MVATTGAALDVALDEARAGNPEPLRIIRAANRGSAAKRRIFMLRGLRNRLKSRGRLGRTRR